MNMWGRVKTSLYSAYASWKGQNYDFSSWQNRTFWGVDNSQLATNETIFSVITRLSNTMSSLPLKLYQNYDVVHTDVSDVITNFPNANMTSAELINKLEVTRNETGNAYAVILRDHLMQVIQILPLDNTQITPVMDSDTGELWYQFRGNNKTSYVHNMNIIHLKHITGSNRIEGISPLKVLKNSLLYDKAVQEFSLSEMEKKESFILKYGANVSEDKQKTVVSNFKRFYQENGGILFQEPGVEIKDIDKKYTASDTISSEKVTRTRVANVFNVPISFLNETGGGFSNNEQMMIQFVQMTITPILRQYEQEFNRKLLTPEERKVGFYYKFNVNSLLRGDTAARTAFYQMMLRTAGMTPNEVRALEDLPPVSGKASELFISGDLYPINLDVSQRNGSIPKATEGGEKHD